MNKYIILDTRNEFNVLNDDLENDLGIPRPSVLKYAFPFFNSTTGKYAIQITSEALNVLDPVYQDSLIDELPANFVEIE